MAPPGTVARRERNIVMDSIPPQESTSPDKGRTGFVRLYRAFGYSMAGLAAALRHEDAFRQEAACALVLIPAAFWLTSDPVHRALLVGSVLLVLIVELLNSALEAAVDRISLERHALAKQAKDIGSAAVFMAIVNAVAVWAILLW